MVVGVVEFRIRVGGNNQRIVILVVLGAVERKYVLYRLVP